MKNLKIMLLASVFALTLFSCSNDDDGPVKDLTINIENPDAVSAGLTFVNGTATYIKGAPPAPSTNPAAPVLGNNNQEDAVGISGSNLALQFNETTGNTIKGVYLQVKDASGYYNIELTNSNSGGRLFGGQKARVSKSARVQEHDIILLGLPANLAPGVFCVTYCVYDDQNRVSNPIEVCIEVKSFGGKNSEFLTANAWQLESYYFKITYGGFTVEETRAVGEDYTDTYTTGLYCMDGSYYEVGVVEAERTNYVYATFLANGTLTIASSTYLKYMDGNASTCETGVVYIEDTDEGTGTGGWSYNDTSKELTTVSVDEYEEEGEVVTETSVSVFKTAVLNGKLKLSVDFTDEDGTYSQTLTFVPKN